MKRVEIPALTGVRFVAALLVLVGHFWSNYTFPGRDQYFRFLDALPPLGMVTFFVLSGFVMWINYAEPMRRNFFGALWNFAVARFARLYPLYFVVGLFALTVTSWPDLPREMPDIFLFVPLVQAWVPGYDLRSAVFSIPQLGHTWSISVEMFLYACFPAICIVLSMPRSLLILLFSLVNLAVFSLAIWYYTNHIADFTNFFIPWLPTTTANMWIGYYSPLSRVFEFAAGCAAAALWERTGQQSASGYKHGLQPLIVLVRELFALAALALIVFAASLYFIDFGIDQATKTALQRVLPVAGTSYLLFHICRYGGLIARVLEMRAIEAGGTISYSLYLLHPFIFPWFVKDFAESSWLVFFGWFFMTSMAILTTIIISIGTYTAIEVPARRWLRAKLTRPELRSPSSLAVPADRAFPGQQPAEELAPLPVRLNR